MEVAIVLTILKTYVRVLQMLHHIHIRILPDVLFYKLKIWHKTSSMNTRHQTHLVAQATLLVLFPPKFHQLFYTYVIMLSNQNAIFRYAQIIHKAPLHVLFPLRFYLFSVHHSFVD